MSELHSIVCDGYDREMFSAALSHDASVARALERASRLLPNAEALLCDLFGVLFKLNVVLRPKEELSASVMIHRRLVESVLRSSSLAALRRRTELDPVRSGWALGAVVDRLLSALRREYRVGPETLLEAAELAHDEGTVDVKKREQSELERLPEGAFDEVTREKLKAGLEREIRELEGRIERGRRAQESVAERLSTEIEDAADFKVRELPQRMEDVDEQMRGLGIGETPGGRTDAEKKRELGERLLASKKLRLLARLVGAFREVAFEARRRRVARSPQELHSVQIGASLERLLPSEAVGLGRGRRLLHLDFLRRYAEGQLLEYELIGASSRGPMVVCVDGSGSMSGSKELWAKAVALTLMEIARRERRRFLAIVFSSGASLFEAELLDSSAVRGHRARVDEAELVRFAEHFPGGGTSFEEPLGRAVSLVSEGRYRRGDIVFITDGEAEVSNALLEDLRDRRKKHRFRIHGILVDVSHARSTTLERFADDVRRVSDLTADSMSDLFASV